MTRTGIVLFVACALLPGVAQAQRYLGKSESDWSRILDSEDAKVRRSAAFALGKLGNGEAARSLVAALRDRDPAVRDAAAFALGEIGQRGRAPDSVRQPLQDRLQDEDARVRRSAAYALGCCGLDRTSEADLLKALHDHEATVRQNAAWALGKAGPRASSAAVQALIDSTKRETDPLALRDVAGALGTIGKPAASSAAEPLARLFQDTRDPLVRKTTLTSLITVIGPEMAKAEPGTHDALVRALRDTLRGGDPETKGLVAGALDQLGEHAVPALADLADLIDDDRATPDARRNATVPVTKMWRAIQAMPEADAQNIIKKLARALDPKHPVEVRRFTGEALARIGFPLIDPATVPLVQALDRDRDPDVRQQAAFAFINCEKLGELPEVVGVLRKTLKDPNLSVRYDAARALGHGLRERAGEDAIDVLDTMLHDKRLLVYWKADTNVKGGSESSGGGSSVKKDSSGDGRFMAAKALGLIGPTAARSKIVATLKEMTQSNDTRIKDHAVEALGKMGK